MKAYKVTAGAKATFLATATDVPITSVISPRIYCEHRCLSRRSTRFDFSSCNGFMYEDGHCYLGYADPNWIYEQSLNQGSDAKLYFDILFP